jgi:hypothetical protein
VSETTFGARDLVGMAQGFRLGGTQVEKLNNFDAMEQSNAFDELPEEDKQAAVDISCAASILVTRLPSISETLFAHISREFGHCFDLPLNKAKYALRTCGQRLFVTEWRYEITKTAQNSILTKFEARGTGQEPETLD